MRVETGATQMARNGGWLHVLKQRGPSSHRRVATLRVGRPRLAETLEKRVLHWQAVTPPERLDELASQLGVAPAGLAALGTCLVSRAELRRLKTECRAPDAWAFPMRDPAGSIVGVRLRSESGYKWSIRGSRQGLFTADCVDISREPLIIGEGPTDTAALLGVGVTAIGRPSCLGAVAETITFARRHSIKSIIVLSDGDDPGRRGALILARRLGAQCLDVRIALPPCRCKDAREWIASGADSCDVIQTLDATAVRIEFQLTPNGAMS